MTTLPLDMQLDLDMLIFINFFFDEGGVVKERKKKIFILYFFYHLDVHKNVNRQTNHPIIINSEYLWLFSSRRFLTPNTHCSSNNCTVTIFFFVVSCLLPSRVVTSL